MEKYSIIWTSKSVSDLSECVSFVLNVSKESAYKLYKEIKEGVVSLSLFPERNPVFEMPSSFPQVVRKLIISKRYIVLYGIDQNQIFVFRILDSRKKFISLL